VEKENHLIFQKRIGSLNDEPIHNCPSCGHPMDINQNGKCNYCGTIYDQENLSWILSSFEVL